MTIYLIVGLVRYGEQVTIGIVDWPISNKGKRQEEEFRL